jgi:hypothetical protein
MIETREARLHLQRLKQWAEERIQGGTEPPWAWYNYMKLIEASNGIIESLDCTTTVDLQRGAKHSETALRLVDSTDLPRSSPPRPPEPEVRLPM